MRLCVLLSLLQGVSSLPYLNADTLIPWAKTEVRKDYEALDKRAFVGQVVNPLLRLFETEVQPTPGAAPTIDVYTPPARSSVSSSPAAAAVSPVVPSELPVPHLPAPAAASADSAPAQRITTLTQSVDTTTSLGLTATATPPALPAPEVETVNSVASSTSSIATSSSSTTSSARPVGTVSSSSTSTSSSVVVVTLTTSNSSSSVRTSTSSSSSLASSSLSSDAHTRSRVKTTSSSTSSTSSSHAQASSKTASTRSTTSLSISTSSSRAAGHVPGARLTHFPIPIPDNGATISSSTLKASSTADLPSWSYGPEPGQSTECDTPLPHRPTESTPGTSPSPSSLTSVQRPRPAVSPAKSSNRIPDQPVEPSKVTVSETRTPASSRLRTTTLSAQSTRLSISSFFQAQDPVTVTQATTLRAPEVTILQPTTVDAPPKTVTIRTTLTVSETQRVTVLTTPSSVGTVITSLNTKGQNTQAPIRTVSVSTTAPISPITAGPSVIDFSTAGQQATSSMSANIFVPIASNAPPAQIPSRGDQPVPRTGIIGQRPFQTNKFYANFFLGTRKQGTWTHPYSVAWVQGSAPSNSWGLGISHVTRNQTVYGPGSPARYFVNPVGIESMIISAQEIESGSQLTMDSLRAFSVDVNLSPQNSKTPAITFPLVQGMGFVTGVFNNATPLLQSGVYFKTIVFGGRVAGSSTVRYVVTLMDNTTWLVYLTPSSGNSVPTLTLLNNSKIVGSKAFSGSLQVAKNPNGAASQAIYDGSAGVYPIQGAVQATVSQRTGTYSLSWVKSGIVERKLLMFALPHHVQSFSGTKPSSALQLITTTKGMSTAVVADSWQLVENDLPFDMGFAPWSPTLRSQTTLPANARTLISSVSAMELNEDMDAQTNLNSMYFSGKALAKFAFTLFAANNLAGNTGAASAGLVKLKQAFARFVNNQQQYPLAYDTAWGGVISTGAFITGQPTEDFGNTYYNDHHFHYGYFVYTAAVIGFLDPNWLTQGTNKAWVNSLVRDYANPASNDPYFPFSRMFDWYHGHSWAHGLYETADGKDQESSSEDAFSSYALKMWGRTIRDANMEARGNLMLSIQARSLGNYYLMESNNTVQPPNFVGNKAAGILFENKCDHTTYFGTNIEYIEGIHMLPLNPSSTLTRKQAFVQQEWDQYFSGGRANVDGGWRGILYANLAIIDPKSSYNFFAASNFDSSYLDGGASRSWYLAFAAGLGGAS